MAPEHPPFREMVASAIGALRERSGSSVRAITKYIGQEYGDALKSGVMTWEQQVKKAIKNMEAKGDLVKVKNSFKLGEALKKQKPSKPRTKKAAEGGEKKAAKKPAAAKKTPKKKAAPKAKKTATKKKAAPKAKTTATKKKAAKKK